MYCNSYIISRSTGNNSKSYFGASRPLDNLMMQGSLLCVPPPLLSLPPSLPLLLQGSNFSLFLSRGTQKLLSLDSPLL